MHGDELQLKAAGEEAEHEQNVGAVGERFATAHAAAIARLRLSCASADGGVASANDSGSTASMLTAKIISVCCQPNVSISATATGE